MLQLKINYLNIGLIVLTGRTGVGIIMARRLNMIEENIAFSDMKIIELKLEIVDDIAMLYIEAVADNKVYSISFTNVSQVNIRDFSTPFQIAGFEIFSNKNRGWEKSLTYTIHDYEDGKVSFYCEDFDVEIK